MGIIDELLLQDKTYSEDTEEIKRIEKLYNDLPLKSEHRMIIEDYIACINTANARKCKISYIYGLYMSDDRYM